MLIQLDNIGIKEFQWCAEEKLNLLSEIAQKNQRLIVVGFRL